ncbi:MAG: DNA mismatch repair endonuclease MutL [Eubacteriales bacterium]|nr:DNA mismatch repair endonuclease MutL [Eubacteriales bacterium]
MAKIKVLDQNTINQIAAGEVVERPASIVKELVENAIDAKSSAVTVEIKGGGIDFIRITDNGAGIEESQVRTAFLRHATSKIDSADDLETVSSLGFRGEALSSIAAVAKVELITKTDEGISGVRYVIEGGEEVSFEVIGCPEGTTFIIRNLFYNTPARRKFLKSKMTEAGYVEAFMQRLALSHPNISFRFICDNKNKISTSGNGNLKDVIYHIYGRDIALNLLEVRHRENDIEVYGFVGKPIISRGNRAYENYFVNGRYLKNNIITKAIEDGYKGHSMVHKFPFTALMIKMDPHSFDANVHPAKMEMRFHNGEYLYAVISKAVSNSFVRKELIPKVGFEERKQERRQVLPKTPEPFESKRRKIEERFSSLTDEKIKDIEKKKNEPLESQEKKPATGGLSERIRNLTFGNQEKIRQDVDKEMNPPKKEQIFSDKKDDKKVELLKELGSYGPKDPEQKRMELPKEDLKEGKQISFIDIPLLSEQAKPKHRLIGQAFRTYWIVEFEDKLFFVDQHAAHEKVKYEKLKKDLEEKTIHQQMIAPPIILSLNMKEQEKLLGCMEAFKKLGFLVEEFGGNEYCIRAVPADLIDLNQQSMFIELLDSIDDNTGKMSMDILTDKLASMACKAAVKGNMSMTFAEMDTLMSQLMELENPYQCPHGRPTIISMTKYELEKKFKRIQ